jgi:O-antigen ligase
VTERIPKSLLIGGAILAPLFLAYLAYSLPWYFTSEVYLGGLLLLELLFAAIWMYRQVFFPLVLTAFLFAGSNLPVGGFWTQARWLLLGVGALVGCIVVLKDRCFRFGMFHALALFAALAALVSAAASRYPGFALLKALSLLLLFVYGATGARLAVAGRENRFFAGLLTGCEVFVAAIMAFHLIGIEAMGNPNSLGAVTGVVGAPILLWGMLLDNEPKVRYRRLVLFAVCLYLVFNSHARAGMAAALVSCVLLCLGLRKYKPLVVGLTSILVLIAAAGIFRPEILSTTVSSVTYQVVFKSKNPEVGLLASREAPWQAAIDVIRDHLWFGTGFGTTDNGRDASEHLSKFSSTEGVTAENGSSYLAIITWVGVLGVLPFLMTLLVLISNIVRTVVWMWKTGNPSHPAIPLAVLMVAGLIHAGLEDWLFAPGYYLCVFFWSAAFVFVDMAPSVPLPRFEVAWRRRPIPQDFGGIAQSR